MSKHKSNGSGSNGSNFTGNSISHNALPVNGSTEFDAKKLFRLLFSYKWMILIVVFASTAAMYLYADSIIPIYQGEGTMIISQSQDSYVRSGSDMNSMLSSSFGIGRGSTIANEIGVLKSRQFALVIADQILDSPFDADGRLNPLLWREYPEDASMVNKDVLTRRIQGRLAIEQDEDYGSDMVMIKFNSPSPYEAATVSNMVLDSYTQFSSDKNREQVRAALGYLDQEMASVKQTLNNNEEKMRNFMHEEKLIELDSQTKEIISAMSNLQIERQAVAVQKVGVNSSINSYRNELDRIKPGFAKKYSEGLSTKLTRFQYRLAELETEKMLMVQRNPRLKENPGEEPSLLQINSQIEYLKTEIANLANEYIGSDSHALSFLGSPEGDLVGRVTDLSQQLISLEIDSQQLQAQADVLDQRLGEYQVTFDRLPDNLIEYARIQREIETNEQLYLSISGQIAELSVWEQTQASMGRVVDYAEVPNIPIEPRTQLMLIWAFILGWILSFGLVYIREMSSNRLNSIEKLMQKKLTVLSVIPDITSQKAKLFGRKKLIEAGDYTISPDLITILDPISYASEAYRRLLSNIMFSQSGKSYKSILVTSPNKAEGKSSMIANLAVVYAETGMKVAMLDCDFRHPKQHKLWGLPASPGAVDVLISKTKLEHVIQPTVVNNIHVITAGEAPNNPAEMVQGQKMKDLVNKLKDIYDVVLIDSPPFGFITDAAPLMQYVDGVALVTRFNQSKEPELDQCLGNLEKINANIIGTTMMSFNYKKATGYDLETGHFKNAFENYNRYNKIGDNKKRAKKY